MRRRSLLNGGTTAVPLLMVLQACAAARGAGPAKAAADPPDADGVHVTAAAADRDGVLVHEVTSPFQAGTTRIRVLLPEKWDGGKRYAVVYVLPVEAKEENRFGDGLLEVKRHDLHDQYQAVFVAPTFSHLPWYADHPSDPAIRQEAYLLNVVLPFVEKTYPVRRDAGGRLLLGFSKSGWGAFSLLLRHPDLFGRAVAWDAPLMMDHPGPYGSGPIFGDAQNFERYHVARLLEQRAAELGKPGGGERLILLGYGNFRAQHQQARALMEKLKVPHVYEDGPERKHEWGSGWLPEAVRRLSPPAPATRPS